MLSTRFLFLNRQAVLVHWSIHHPIGVIAILFSLLLIGLFSIDRLAYRLLPDLSYPSIGVRVNAPGVPALVMEDEVTRQLEEQLAITENALYLRSATREGRSAVDIEFDYGTDMDIALRDASARLDRAKRFLPDWVQPPIIYKRDPSQLPVMEYALSSSVWTGVELRSWADYQLSKYLLNIPGVAAVEVAGGARPQVQIRPFLAKLNALGLDVLDLKNALQPYERLGARLEQLDFEQAVQTAPRWSNLIHLSQLNIHGFHLEQLAQVLWAQEKERIKIRLQGEAAVKLSIQKQPQANTVAVVQRVQQQIAALQAQGLIPQAVHLQAVADEAKPIKNALRQVAGAALSGAVLAMLVVYLFLRDWRRSLIIGSAIPIAILLTLSLMQALDISLNLMSLGGLALGVGLLVDSTIVILENIARHQSQGLSPLAAAEQAGREVSSALIAATATNLAAILPFLWVGGLIGLLFQELILTIGAAMLIASLVALSLVPALAARLPSRSNQQSHFMRQHLYAPMLKLALRFPYFILSLFLIGMIYSLPRLWQPLQQFLPPIDDGRIGIYLTADRGTALAEMDQITRRIEAVVLQQPDLDSVLTTVGGFIFGRSQYETAHRASLQIQLKVDRQLSSRQWIKQLKSSLPQIAGVKIRIRQRRIRGLRLGRGDDQLNFYIQGPDLKILSELATQALQKLSALSELKNIKLSHENQNLSLRIQFDEAKAKQYDMDVNDFNRLLKIALQGERIANLIHQDRSLDIVLFADQQPMHSTESLQQLILFNEQGQAVRLGQIAQFKLIAEPETLLRQEQQRVIEISASLTDGAVLAPSLQKALDALHSLNLPPDYFIYEGGQLKRLKSSQQQAQQLLILALVLVFTVMAVQYESIRYPLLILFSVPFTLIGVSWGLYWTQTPLSMPVWLGLIMLAGIVVNNAIILVETIQYQRRAGQNLFDAVMQAAQQRMRPILMTSLTTIIGLLPLASAWGEGSELLQPLAITLISGLLFSLTVSLLLIPSLYYWLGYGIFSKKF